VRKKTFMKQKRFHWIPALFLSTIFCMGAFISFAQRKKDSPAIERVLHNLSSEIQVEGVPNWTLFERMAYYHVKGVSIAVIKDYSIEWAKAFGWADSAEQRPATTATKFQAGSISKSLNGVGIMKLVQEQKLDLYTDINEYLKKWKFPYDSLAHGKKITLANLLSHTAGLTVHGFPGYERGDPIPTLPQVLDGKRPANTAAIRSLFEPSLKAQYSGGGTTISQLIVEDITQMPYDQFMWENVLQPIGMNHSSFTQPPAVESQNQFATAYNTDGKAVKGKYHIYPEEAAAGLWTTPTDLSKYIIETQLSILGKSAKALSKEMNKLRLTPYIDSSTALGVFIDTRGGQKYFGHSGQDEGFVARYWGSFEGGYGVVVMANTDDMSIIDEIINSVAIVYQWKEFYKPFMVLKPQDISSDLLNSYVGDYLDSVESNGQFNLAPGSLVTISKKKNQLSVQVRGQEKVDIYPERSDRFFPKTSDTDITFVKDAKGMVTKITIHQQGKFIECQKLR